MNTFVAIVLLMSLCGVSSMPLQPSSLTPFDALKNEIETKKLPSATATGVPALGARNNDAAKGPKVDVKLDSRYPNGINATILSDTLHLIRPGTPQDGQTQGIVPNLGITPAALAQASQRALMFNVCPSYRTRNDRVAVNWFKSPVRGEDNFSLFRYQICRASGLQARLITGFLINNPGNSFLSRPFVGRVDICGPNSLTKTPCENRDIGVDDCLTGQVRAPFRFDPNALTATLSLLTNPPATSITKLCL